MLYNLLRNLTPLDISLSMLRVIPKIIFPSKSKSFTYSKYIIKKNKNNLASVCILYRIKNIS